MGNASTADRPPNRPVWLPLAAAGILVPTVLAGLTLLWPGPRIEDQLGRGATEALAAAGLAPAAVSVAGRDATVSGTGGADAERALAVVAGVPGVRSVRIAGDDDAAAGGAAAGDTAPGDAAPGDAAPGDAAPGDAAPGDAAPGDAASGDAAPGGVPGAGVPGGGELDDAAGAGLQAQLDALLGGSPITFRPDSPELTPAGAAAVERVLELVTAAPGARLQVDGFVASGPGGGVLTAQELSDQRAATVRDALVEGGVPADRIVARGLGEGDTPAARDAGRRVEITVV